MKIDDICFHLDREADPVSLHPYAHFLLGQQPSAFIYWMVIENEIKTGLPKPIKLRIEIVSPPRRPSVRILNGSTYIVELPVRFERFSLLPFKMVEGRMSKIFRLKGLTTEPELHHLFDAPASNAFFLEILLQALENCIAVFQADTDDIRQNFQRFTEKNYIVTWIKATKRFPEYQGVAVLHYILDSYSMKKEIALLRNGNEVDRCLVEETGPHHMQWAGPFPIRVEGREVVMGHGTFRYEPFRGVRVVSL
jgi:hypothetical protein